MKKTITYCEATEILVARPLCIEQQENGNIFYFSWVKKTARQVIFKCRERYMAKVISFFYLLLQKFCKALFIEIFLYIMFYVINTF